MSINGNHNISKPKAWLLAARPKTLPAAVAPVLVGTALAYALNHFSLLPALAALGAALLIQISGNFANDYFDFFKGIDTPERKGPLRVVASGLISAKELKIGLALVMALAFLIGLYLTWVAGWPILVVGILSLMCALAYSGGPYPLASRGLGDVFVFIFFGMVAVSGTYFVQAGDLSSWALMASVPMGGLITAILVVNNLRDIETDQQAGKFTLAVMMGPDHTRLEYSLLIALAYLTPVIMWINGWLPWVFLPFLSMPLAIILIRKIYTLEPGPEMNKLLAQTAQLTLLYSILFAIGLIIK